MARPRLASTRSLISLSAAVHLVLLGYAHYVDTHPDQFGGLRYTDVDWRVVVDGLDYLARPPTHSHRAQGIATTWLNLPLGSPYHRETFRYSPLLPILLAPNLLHPLLGKLTLVVISLAIPPILLSGTHPARFWPTHLLWTLNPIVLNITTRGSPEAVACLLSASLVVALRRARLGTATPNTTTSSKHVPIPLTASSTSSVTRWELIAAALLALGTSYKIYPAIYVPAIWSALSRRHGWFGWGVWRFGLVSATVAGIVNGILWLFWGQPFLDHTFLYHLTRLDHRHNFSPYYLPIYLGITSNTTVTESAASKPIAVLLSILRHPLASFIPQTTLVLGAGLALTPTLGLESAMFFQTCLFVIFNKVCTSQYFLWPIPFIPLISYPHLSNRLLASLVAAWIAAQALWLATAYQLEFLARPVYLQLWAAGLVLFLVSVFAVGKLLDAASPNLTVVASDALGQDGLGTGRDKPKRE